MSGENVTRKEKNHQNIQVFVRLRPLNQRERELRSLGIVEVSGNKEVIVRPHGSLTKKFTFDRAFGPHSKQIEVYREVVSPLIEEVLSGYNCTVFAYGQTGTGKTHTMVGENMGGETTWQDDVMAGIIPRALSQLFDQLPLTNNEYAVRVSYLELYNEELFDLLATSDDNSKLRIYEDATKKGSNIVNGLEEIAVYNKNEVYKIMQKGQERRKMAATLMNAQSSRSHTVFTIKVHMKENSPEGEELMKVGKLNLVDLAGSENIVKAGSDNPSKKERARECVNINQSLLTLGRVITALVERHPHIPYRESKLTRLLQESLGGRTKTSIIATISPGHKDMEETLSTLEYANRAKNIQNKPEVNRKMTKHAVIKEYSEEIDRLKRDLIASREKNGIHLNAERYAEIMLKLEDQEKDIQDKILSMEALRDEKERAESIFLQLQESCRRKEAKLQETAANLINTKVELRSTKGALIKTYNKVDEQKHLVRKQAETEEKLSEQAKALLRVATTVTDQVGCLHEVVDKRRKLEDTNLQVTRKFSAEAVAHRGSMRQYLATFTDELTLGLEQLRDTVELHHNTYVTNQNENQTQLNSLIQSMKQSLTQNETRRLETEEKVTEMAKNGVASGADRLVSTIEGVLSKFFGNLVRQMEEARMKDRQMSDNLQEYVQGLHSKQMTEIRKLQEAQVSWWSETSSHLQEVRHQHGEEVQRHTKDNEMDVDLCKGQKKELDGRLDILQDYMQKSRQRSRARSERQIGAIRERMAALEREDAKFKQKVETEISRLSGVTTEVQQRTDHLLECQDSMMQTIRSRVDDSHDSTFNNLQRVQHQVRDQLESVMEKNKQNCTEQVKICHNALDSSHSSHEATVGQTFADDQLESVMEKNKQNCTEQVKICHNALDSSHSSHEATVGQTFADTITATSILQLSSLSSATQAMSETQTQWHESRVTVMEAAQQSLAALGEHLGKNLQQIKEAEDEFFQEFGVYSPTGATPQRQATFPHERILQSFRSLRKTGKPDEPEQIRNENVNHNGSTSSVWSSCDSENVCMSLGNPSTSCPFKEPLPVGKGTPGGNQQVMVKASSEGDIYKLAHKDDKENRSSGKGQFISKLRKPSVKKPQFQHN